MADHQFIKSLFFKFLEDECTSEEIELIITYLRTSPQVDDFPRVDEVKIRLGLLPKMDDQQADRIFEAIINDTNSKTFTSHRGPKFPWWRAAATIVGILLVSGLLFMFLQQHQELHYATSFGENKTIRLPDGTEVTLNANSELRLHEDWEATTAREVWLEGEAFFSVVHTQDNRPFRVHTRPELSVEVLGTRFNVNSRRKEATVVLNSGRVKVLAPQQGAKAEWIMQSGDLIAYESKTQRVTQALVDTTLYTSWRNNLLFFEDTPLSDIATTIKDNYGYSIIFESDSLAQLRFTGSNPADQLDLLLRTLEASFDLQIVRAGKQITIKAKE